MKNLLLLLVILYSITPSLCAPQSFSDVQLNRLSAAGELYVNEEMKRALLGVKQMKELVERNKDKHQQLMTSLQESYEKKKGAEQLAREAEQKLQKAEQDCKDLLKPMWMECQPCLEETCKSFYSSPCHRGFFSLTLQVEEFFRRMSTQMGITEQLFNQGQQSFENISQNQTHNQKHLEEQQITNQHPDGTEVDLVLLESSYHHVQEEVNSLYSHCVQLAAGMHRLFGPSFQVAFSRDVQPRAKSPGQEDQERGYLSSFGVTHALDSFLELSRAMLHEAGSAITDVFEALKGHEEEINEKQRQTGMEWLPMWPPPQSKSPCRHLRKRASVCWQQQRKCESCQEVLIKECPAVPEQYSALGEISLLLNASRQQYTEKLQVVQRSIKHALQWANNIIVKYSWVTHITNGTGAVPHIFRLAKVSQGGSSVESGSRKETAVEVFVLDSPQISLLIPADLELSDPAFMSYVAQEALEAYKHTLPEASTLSTDLF
ncbi:clusterin-like protein 1 [Denticeps clupeoides]|uniref:clusterin-like protein 1 n=1 Tax=Denticeps clupeoides TaxID=299321 RepID=UPI0010A35351|nr:clusterin-like protein 1 [Denticeps clupeoides]